MSGWALRRLPCACRSFCFSRPLLRCLAKCRWLRRNRRTRIPGVRVASGRSPAIATTRAKSNASGRFPGLAPSACKTLIVGICPRPGPGGDAFVARVASGTASQRTKPAGRCASIPGGSRKTICLDQRTQPPCRGSSCAETGNADGGGCGHSLARSLDPRADRGGWGHPTARSPDPRAGGGGCGHPTARSSGAIVAQDARIAASSSLPMKRFTIDVPCALEREFPNTSGQFRLPL